MAQMIKPAQRFTHPEWTLSNKAKYRNAELERMAAERLENESDRLIAETEQRTIQTQLDVEKKLDQRIDDEKYWEDELDKKLGDMDDEIKKLEIYVKRMEQAIEEGTQEPMHITQTCLKYREGRLGIDLVHDDVQRELFKEIEVHQGVQALLQKTVEQAKEQLRLNRKAKFNLEQDMLKKNKAKELDTFVRELKLDSSDIKNNNQCKPMSAESVTPEEWRDSVNTNILESEKQRMNSENIRSIIDGILQQTANDQTEQVRNTDRAFKRRIDETKDSKGKLEEHLQRVLKEISNMEDNIANLKQAIDDKDNPLKLANNRCFVRNTREGIENTRDSAQYRITEEVIEIKTDINSLRQRLMDSYESLKGLNRRKLDLEEEIQIKANTLFIDEVQCKGIRESIRINSY